MKQNDCPQFLRGYLETALFTTDAHPPSGCDYVTSGRATEMWDKLPLWFVEQAVNDCAKFQAENTELLAKAGDDWQNGSDFWYTRGGHGVGYWDRDYPDDVADPLTEAAHKYGEVSFDSIDLGQEEKV